VHHLVDRAGGWKRVIQAALSVAVVAAIFLYALPKVADFGDVWEQITAMTLFQMVTLLMVAGWNIASYWLVMMASLPGSNVWQSFKVNGASTTIANTLPGGSALGIGITYGMYLSYGFERADVGRAVLVSGLWNNFVKLGMPVVALALLALHGGASTATLTASLAGLGMLAAALFAFGLVLYSESLAHRVGRLLGRVRDRVRSLLRKPPGGDMGETTARFRADAIDLLRTRWAWLSIATLVSHVSLFLVLLLSLRYVGVPADQVAWQEILAAFAFVRLISALPITPGGLGVVELGYAAALVAAGGDRPTVLAGVLVFRALTYLLPIPWGVLTYLRWRQGAERRRQRVAAANHADPATETNAPIATEPAK
jgi:uncharacterized membrane protein YbhN (UPF0104 family)